MKGVTREQETTKELAEGVSNTNYENQGRGIDDLPVLSIHSVETSSGSKKSTASAALGFARRMTIGTLKGLGLSRETDFDRVKLMQRARAMSLAGQSQETQKVDGLLGTLKEALDESDEETSPVTLQLKKQEVNTFNEAFMKDIEEFELDVTKEDAQSMADDKLSLPAIDQNLRMSADIDQLALASINKASSTKSKRRRKSSAGPAQLDHLYKWQKKEAAKRSLEAFISADEAWLPSVSLTAEEAVELPPLPGMKSGRRGTIYENYASPQDISTSGLSVQRFRSANQSPKSTYQWDDVKFNLVSADLQASKVQKEGTKALKVAKAEGDGNPPIANTTDLRNNIFTEAVVDGGQGVDEEAPIKEPLFYRSLPAGETKDNYLYGNQALEHYLRYLTFEKESLADTLMERKFVLRIKLNEKKSKIKEALALAKEHYCTDHGIAAKLKRRMTVVKTETSSQQGEQTEHFKAHTGIRLQLESLQTYIPWFIIAVTTLQAILVIVEIGLGGVAPISFTEKKSVEMHETWGGETYITRVQPSNPWIGPSKLTLVNLGAMFAPCCRLDFIIARRVGTYDNDIADGFGCCEIVGAGAGTTTRKHCLEISEKHQSPNYLWTNTTCNNRDIKNTGKAFEAHIFKPCCYSYVGQCILATHTHCLYLDGLWYSDARESCAQVHCGRDVCSMLHIHSINKKPQSHLVVHSNVTEQLEVHTHLQYWRLFISLFYHTGLIHFLLVAALQCVMGLDVERVAGWLRIAAIYLVSGYGGLLYSTVAKPYEPNVGAEGAAFGLVAMNIVELIQAWKLVDKPHRALLKLLFVTTLALTTGFIPQMSLFSQLTGFWLGINMSVICLPYVTFNRWHTTARRAIVSISFLLVLLTISTAIFLLHAVQPAGIGSQNSFDCVINNECDSGPQFLNAL